MQFWRLTGCLDNAWWSASGLPACIMELSQPLQTHTRSRAPRHRYTRLVRLATYFGRGGASLWRANANGPLDSNSVSKAIATARGCSDHACSQEPLDCPSLIQPKCPMECKHTPACSCQEKSSRQTVAPEAANHNHIRRKRPRMHLPAASGASHKRTGGPQSGKVSPQRQLAKRRAGSPPAVARTSQVVQSQALVAWPWSRHGPGNWSAPTSGAARCRGGTNVRVIRPLTWPSCQCSTKR
mmetsp:Transcript_72485/g.188129  ORF Transcript_72485/g.188129 Transcript_72485/m.188129 type:complete len:240 (+) Transcript_72485:63-782(+)